MGVPIEDIEVIECKTPAKTNRYPKAGQPTKYCSEYPQMLLDYFSGSDMDDVEYKDKQTGVTRCTQIKRPFPTLAGFCTTIGVCRDTLYQWAHRVDDNGNLVNREFSDAMKLAKEYQEQILVENTLNGGYVASFASFVAKNLLSWTDTKDVTISGNPDKPLVQITADMSPESAALIYKESLDND